MYNRFKLEIGNKIVGYSVQFNYTYKIEQNLKIRF